MKQPSKGQTVARSRSRFITRYTVMILLIAFLLILLSANGKSLDEGVRDAAGTTDGAVVEQHIILQ